MLANTCQNAKYNLGIPWPQGINFNAVFANTYCLFFVMFAKLEKTNLHINTAVAVRKYNTNKQLQGNYRQKMQLPSILIFIFA